MTETRARPRGAAGDRVPQTLAERFWSVARGMEGAAPEGEAGDPIPAVRHVLAVLDAFEHGAAGPGLSTNTLSFLMLLRQQEMLGDLLYASPEQARGETVDERSLVFSVGVLLFERLTGRHPFGAEGNPRRMARIRRGELGSGVNFFPAVPAGLRHILLKAMGPFPEERWSTLSDLRTRLEEFLSEATAANRPATSHRSAEIVGGPRRGSPGGGAASARSRPGNDDDDQTRVMPRPRLVAAPVSQADDSYVLRRSRVLAPTLWMLLGACLATTVFLLIQSGSPTTSTPAPVPAPVPNPGSRAPDPESRPPATATDTTTGTVPDTTTGSVPNPVPAFDPQLGGERALQAARGCFPSSRLDSGVSFGLGLLYPSGSPTSRKVYLPVDELPAPERACLGQALVGIDPGAPPARSTVVEYRFHLRGPTGTVKVRSPR